MKRDPVTLKTMTCDVILTEIKAADGRFEVVKLVWNKFEAPRWAILDWNKTYIHEPWWNCHYFSRMSAYYTTKKECVANFETEVKHALARENGSDYRLANGWTTRAYPDGTVNWVKPDGTEVQS